MPLHSAGYRIAKDFKSEISAISRAVLSLPMIYRIGQRESFLVDVCTARARSAGFMVGPILAHQSLHHLRRPAGKGFPHLSRAQTRSSVMSVCLMAISVRTCGSASAKAAARS